MADERDPKLSQHYRDLEPLEPPPALDQKILAAAREATQSHAPLVVPTGRHRWYYSLAAAAVLVFAIALTLHIDRDRPDPEAMPSSAVRGEIKQPPKVDTPPAAAQPAPVFTPDPQANAPRESAAETRARTPPPRAEPRPPVRAERSVAEGEAMRAQANAEARAARDAASSAKLQTSVARSMAGAPSAAPAAAAPENPERWLERIAELRSRGRHAEADRELASFRKAYPNYQLSDIMRERVEGTPTPAAQ